MSNIPITSLPLASNLLADDDFPIVQAGTTKRILASTVIAAISPNVGSTVIISAGATVGTPYTVIAGVNRVLINKTVGAATGILFSLASTYTAPILIKDVKGDAATNNITITFTGGELADGLSTIVLSTAYAGIWLNPYPTGGSFYITAA